MFKLLFVVAVALVGVGKADVSGKLYLSLYYESACPDTRSFVLRELYPAMKLLKDNIVLQLVPFGKARVIVEILKRAVSSAVELLWLMMKPKTDMILLTFQSINNGFGGFRCQHGQPECLGNMIQDCTLDLMSSRSDLEKVEYIVCEFQTSASTRGDFSCVAQMDVPTQLVQNCIKSNEGIGLQLKSEYLTKMLNPSFIPTITVDGVFDQKVQDNAMVDLIGTLCSMLPNAKPCSQYYNNQALLTMMS